MRRFLFLVLLAACKGGTEVPEPEPSRTPPTSVTVRSGKVLRIHPVADLLEPMAEFVPPQITLVGVNEDDEAPLFGYDVEIAQAASIGDPVYVADRDLTREKFSEQWRAVMAELEYASLPALAGRPAPRTTTWQRSGIRTNTSRLLVGDNEELPLRSMAVKVRIEGFRARVTLDCVYENDRDRPLEGNFQLRLPEGASPTSLTFSEPRPATSPETGVVAAQHEGWAPPREARIVPRERASQAYRDVVRRGIDPALLEWSGAGVFGARVFPLLPKSMHRIVVGYEVDLVPVGDELEYRLDLPEKVPHLTVDLEVRDLPHRVEPPAPAGRGDHFYEDPDARTFVVRVEGQNLMLHGNDAAAGGLFAAIARPEIEAAPAEPVTRATFLVDLSASSDPEIWLKLLAAILDRNRPTLEEFSVLFFNIEAFWWREMPVANTPGNVEALLADAHALTVEAATDLDRALSAAAQGPAGALFLLSDGAATWGENDGHALASRIAGRTLYAYATGLPGSDPALLALLARESGGALYSVVAESEIPAAAIAHTVRPWRIEKVAMEGASDILLAGRPTTIFPGQALRLAGRGRPPGPLDLTLRRGDAVRTVHVAMKTLESDLAPSAYGQTAVSQLEEADAPAARSYALHFGVVGKSCSLLMLESEAAYQRYGIVPADDAKVVHDEPAAAAVEAALDRPRVRDAKARFLAWLDRLAATQGVDLDLHASIREAAERLPVEAYETMPLPFVCVCRDGDAARGYDDVAVESARRLERHGAPDALRALSTLVEENPGDPVIARDVGYAAMQWGLGGEAYPLFRRVAEARPYEPLAFVAMAQSLADAGKIDFALLCHEMARSGKWIGQSGDFRRILDLQYVRFLRRAAEDPRCAERELARTRLGEIKAPEIADLVVIIEWNTDGTDVDLHVVDPAGEECYFKHRETAIGGTLTEDVTRGYGPEMFLLERAAPGPYAIRAHYYTSDRNRESARTRVWATIYEDFGRPGERVTRRAVTLARGKQMEDIASVVR